MGKNIDKFKEWIGIGEEFEEEFEEDIEEEIDEVPEPRKNVKKSKRSSNPFPITKKSNYDASLVVLKPESFEESKQICDKLKQRKGIYVNLEGIDKMLAQRIVDFVGGSVYALEGNIKKVATAGFIVVPNNISISADLDEDADIDDIDDEYNWTE